jgi:SAM-dependent methyltransferase
MQKKSSKKKEELMKMLHSLLYATLLPLTALHCSNPCIPWEEITKKSPLFLYAGDITDNYVEHYKDYTGLSLIKNDTKHIKHDITLPMPLPDNCVDRYQAEDVFEHIEYSQLILVINEIYRVLKPGGFFRLSIPDYRCDVLYNRATKDSFGNIIFDIGGGGHYENGKVIGGGHVWFPTIENVKNLLESTDFYTYGSINYLHYYDEKNISITKTIDYSFGWVNRTPDHDVRVKNPHRCMSMVIDLYKKED